MLSLPESWELPLCKDLMLLLKTQQRQEIPTPHSAIRSGQRGDPPGLRPLLFSGGRNRDCRRDRDPGALWGLRIQLQIPPSSTSASGREPGAHKSRSLSWRGNRGTGPRPRLVVTPTNGHMMPWGQGLGCEGALWHTRSSPDTTTDRLCRKTEHLWCSYLETRVPQREAGKYFWLSEGQADQPFARPSSPPACKPHGVSLNHRPQRQGCRDPDQRPQDTKQKARPHGDELSSRLARSLGIGYPQRCQLYKCDWRSRRHGLNPPRNCQTRGQQDLDASSVNSTSYTNTASSCFPPVSEQATLQKEPFQAGKKKQSWSDNKNQSEMRNCSHFWFPLSPLSCWIRGASLSSAQHQTTQRWEHLQR